MPVLLDEVLTALAIAPGERHVDGTFGAGGYSAAMVDHGAQVFALDRDPDAIAEGHALVAAKGGALTLIEGRFSEMRSEEHTSELQSLMRISYAVFCLKKKK